MSRNIRAGAASESADRIALAVAFVAGVGGGVILKLMPASGDWAAGLAAGWSALTLFAYVGATWVLRRLRIEPETIGDNCYYLGFVFTLTSLAVTLYQIAGADGGQGALRAVISGFGIALVSTIVGISLRVFLIRLRPDLVSRDREARIELYDGIRNFRTGLSDGVETFRRFSVESVQIMSEQQDRMRALGDTLMKNHEESMRRGAEVHMAALRETIASGSRAAAEAIAGAVESSLKSSTGQFETGLTAMREDLSVFLARESEALRDIIGSAGKVADGAELLHVRVDAVAERLDGLATRLDATTKEIGQRFDSATRGMEAASTEAANRIRKSFSAIAKAANSADAGLLASRIEAFSSAFDRPVAALERTAERLEAVSEALSRREAAIASGAAREGGASAAEDLSGSAPKLNGQGHGNAFRPAPVVDVDEKPAVAASDAGEPAVRRGLFSWRA